MDLLVLQHFNDQVVLAYYYRVATRTLMPLIAAEGIPISVRAPHHV